LLGRTLAVLQAYEAETFTLQTGGLARLMIAAPLRTKWLQLGRNQNGSFLKYLLKIGRAE
jgi:hypothetical protein